MCSSLDWAKAGIELHGHPSVGFPLSITENKFEQLCNGILAYNCKLNVIRCEFKDILSSFPNANSNYNIYTLGTTNLNGIGIFSTGSNQSNSSLYQIGLGVMANPVNFGSPSFDNCDYGIIALLSKSNIRANNMENIHKMGIFSLLEPVNSNNYVWYNRIVSEGMGIGKLFTETGYGEWIMDNEIIINGSSNATGNGIYVANYFAAPPLSLVKNNGVTMNNGAEGIQIYNAKGIQINNNILQLNNNTTNLRGISLRYSDAANMTCNHVTGLSATANNASSFYIEKSQGWNIECNHSEDTYTGFEFRNMSGSTDAFRGNHIESHHVGLQVDANSIMGGQKHTGNWWAGAYGFSGYVNPNAVVQQDRIVVHTYPTPSNVFHPYIDPSYSSWFLVDEFGIPWENCNPNCGILQLRLGERLTELDSLIAEGEITDSLYQAEMQYSGSRFLFEKLSQDSTLLDSSLTMQTFFNSMTGTSIDKFHEVKTEYLAQSAYDSIKVQLAVNDSLIDNALKEISENDSLLQIETDSIIIANLRNSNKALYTMIQTLSIENQTLYAPVQAASIAQVNELRDKNGNIVDISLYVTNERLLNDIYFSTFAKGVFTFTQEQQQQITNIAYQCPYTGGDAVYRARALQFVIDGTLQYDDASACAAQNVAYRKPTIKNETLISTWLIPNPTEGVVTLNISEKVQENTALRLFDSMGKTIKNFTVISGTDSYSFDTETLAAGIYHYSISIKGIELRGKLVVAK